MNYQKQIYCDDKNIGTVQISREGLYYRFECRCNFPKDGIYRLRAYCNENSVYLGVCVPVGNDFGVTTKIPANKLGVGDIRVIAETKEKGRVLPVEQENPFLAIADLDRAQLCLEGIKIKD